MTRYTFAALLLLTACSDGPGTTQRLKAAGYMHIETTGYPMFGCSRGDDGTNTGFKAVGADGMTVTGVMCCGLWKGCTIRID